MLYVTYIHMCYYVFSHVFILAQDSRYFCLVILIIVSFPHYYSTGTPPLPTDVFRRDML